MVFYLKHILLLSIIEYKKKKLEKNKVLFKIIKKKTYIKTKYKAFVDFALIKSNIKSKKKLVKKTSLLNRQNIKNMIIKI